MTSIADQLSLIKNTINEAEKELVLLQSGRKVSASRARKQLQNIKTQSQGLRKTVVLYSKDLPTKKRPIKITPEPVEPLECLTQPVEPVECLTQPEPTKKKRTNKNNKESAD